MDGTAFLGAAAENLLPARLQMAVTLGAHIILASLGVGLPVLMLAAEWRYLRTGNRHWYVLTKRWSKAFAVMFPIGAVSGTVLSFELGLLWPEFMGRWGSVIGMPFTMEGFAFFLEAIFAGIYLYGWDRLSARAHWYIGWPIAIAGFFSAFFVVTANSWMNVPSGFQLVDGTLKNVDPLAAMFNPATGAQVTHMILAAYLVTGFVVAAFYARQLLKDAHNDYARRALSLSLWIALPLAPVQLIIGDWSAKVVAETQPVKLAAMEGLYETTAQAPLHLGGWPNDQAKQLDYAIALPGVLSWLAYGDPNAVVLGLEEFPPEEVPPVAIVHIAFQIMVAIGTAMVLLALWGGIAYVRKGSWPRSRAFLWAIWWMGPCSVAALEAGWIVTEVGRQPWIVQGYMKTAEAVTEAPGIWPVFAITIFIYLALGVATVLVLRHMASVPVEEVQDGS
ncbi:MAG: cytochrome ubiquinol oxidase subunit I [Pirellulaceae bacterium]|nr:MAG: cytochrome ubiquinol oxidase subunit I [Pirellulaceae bacterium]